MITRSGLFDTGDNPRIARAEVQSEVCTGQSQDCPNPRFAHNVYSESVTAQAT